VETFLHDVLDGHHGDHAANYLTKDAQFHAGLVVTGTQEGPLLGIPATGRHLQWDAIDLYRLKGGKISQEWASEDLTAILNDTGTYKAPWIP
jgi:predicted ester cyclase